MTDLSGKLISEPLKRGGEYCLFHAVLFYAAPTHVDDAVVVYLDLETTGLSLHEDHIVEIGVIAENGETFATVVNPQDHSETSATDVHGIDIAELSHGPTFKECFSRVCRFLTNVKSNATKPYLLIAAHNGKQFDFPMMLSECYRHHVPIDVFSGWLYVDTLDVARALQLPCIKLQCLIHMTSWASHLRAHRALDC